MQDHFDKNMTRKNGKIPYNPDYLSHFKYKKQTSIDVKVDAIKSGEYSLEQEEIKFGEIIKELQTNAKRAYKKFKNIGLLNFVPKTPVSRFRSYDKNKQNINESG